MAFDDQDVRHATEAAPDDRRLRRERAPAGDDDHLGPRSSEGTRDTRVHGIVVMKDLPRAGHARATEEHGPVPGIDAPRSPGNGLRGVDHRQVDVRLLGDAVEEWRAIRRRLGEHRAHADHA